MALIHVRDKISTDVLVNFQGARFVQLTIFLVGTNHLNYLELALALNYE